jgi:Uma2 family endonuclease
MMMYDRPKENRKPYLVKESGWTVDEYYELPEEEGVYYEVVNGRLDLQPSPSSTHQRISQQMERKMVDSCEQDYIIFHAPLDVILSPTDTRQPDILAVHRSREQIITERGVEGPPDLVVEILSPSTAKRDRKMKRDTYALFGVLEYWIVDPSNLLIEVYSQTVPGEPYGEPELYAKDDTMKSRRMPCVSFAVGDVLRLK